MQVSNVTNAYMNVPKTKAFSTVDNQETTYLSLGKDSVEISAEAVKADMERKNIEFFGEETYRNFQQNQKLSIEEINRYREIATEAKDVEDKRQFILGLNKEDRAVVQHAHSLADRITDSRIARFSDEGAYNLVSAKATGGLKDFDSDAVVEVGDARTLHFPPLNSPDEVKAAWDKVKEEYPIEEIMVFELMFAPGINEHGNQVLGLSSQAVPGHGSMSDWSSILDGIYNNIEINEKLGNPMPEMKAILESFDEYLFGTDEDEEKSIVGE